MAQHVRPLIQQLLHRPALHASAVASPMGVVAFIGPSGAGKSTLAALLAGAWPLAADDYLPVELSDPPMAIPTATSLNLRPDSGRHLAPLGAERAGKIVMDVSHASTPTRLVAVYALRAASAGVTIASLSPRDALLTLAAELHRLDPKSPDLLRAELDHLHGLAVSVRVAHLTYPRRFDVGSEVVAAITEDLRERVELTPARDRSRG